MMTIDFCQVLSLSIIGKCTGVGGRQHQITEIFEHDGMPNATFP